MRIKKWLSGITSLLLSFYAVGSVAYADEAIPKGCPPFYGKLDISFAIDTTGSMKVYIDNVKSSANSIVDSIDTRVSDYRIAVSSYRDFNIQPYGNNAVDYPYKPISPFTADKSTISNAINSLDTGNGGDIPESVFAGLRGSIEAEGIGAWREDAYKAIILIGDAPPHDALNTPSYSSYPDQKTVTDVVYSAIEKNIKIYSVVVGKDASAIEYFSRIAEETGGKTFIASRASEITKSILDAIGTIMCTQTNQPPDVTGAEPSLSRIWPPNHKMVPISINNVVDPEGGPVTISIKGITQDEPVETKGSGNTSPDGSGVGTEIASVRAERSGKDNSRVYRISFIATDDRGATSEGSVVVVVPHDQNPNGEILDDGQLYDSTIAIN